MSMLFTDLSNRTQGAYPVSIGTSLALESIAMGPNPPYDPMRQVPDKIDLSKYNVVYVNLATLYRNIMGSLPPNSAKVSFAIDICNTMEVEADVIWRLIKEVTHDQTKVIFYHTEYKDLQKEHPKGTLRLDKTEKQIINTATMKETIKYFMHHTELKDKVKTFDRLVEGIKWHKVLFITHMAYDLLALYNFASMDLLESHTGILKSRANFHTKLLNGKDLPRIPFNAAFLQVFGDSNTFSPMAMKVKTQIEQLADKQKWTGMTSKDKVRSGLDSMNDKFTALILKEMLKEV